MLIKSREPQLYQEPSDSSIGEHMNHLMRQRQLPLFATKRNGETDTFENHVLTTRDGITLMCVCNNKRLTQTLDLQKYELPDHPFCYVIIDLRPDAMLVAIEQNAAFNSNPDRVRDILVQSFSLVLAQAGYKVEIRAKMNRAPFWETIEKRILQGGDRVARIAFDFPDTDHTEGMNVPQNVSEKIRVVGEFTRMMGGNGFGIHGAGGVRLDRMREDTAAVISFCCNHGYAISVYFTKSKMFRYGDQVKVTYEINENVIKDFNQGQTFIPPSANESVEAGCYALATQLDEINLETNQYDETPEIQPRRKRKNKHAF